MGIGRVRAVALVCALGALFGLGVTAPAHAAEYPSWDEVEAARGNAGATAATIANLSALLDGLQAEAASLGDVAVARGAEAELAQQQADRAASVASSLSDQADAAAKVATRSNAQASEIAAALYRSGGADLTGTLLLVSAKDSEGLLSRLGSLDRVGGRLTLALESAQVDRNQAEALSQQAMVAKSERDRLSADAATALATAQTAADAANAAVAQQQANLSQLYEQLASLKNTTVELEQQYRIGLESGNDPGAGGGGGDGGGGGVITPPGSDVNDPTAARYFAFAQLSAMGFGEEQYSCILWLWNRESGWRTNAYNASSGAYGIPQSLPGSKMAAVGADWRTNYQTQVRWGLIYIQGRYGSPCDAWAHSEAVGWY